jgi:hypothetical protein
MRPKSRSSPPFALGTTSLYGVHSHARKNTIAYATCNQLHERIKFNNNRSTRHCRHVSPLFRPSVSLAPFLEEPVIIVIIVVGRRLLRVGTERPTARRHISVRHSSGAIVRRHKNVAPRRLVDGFGTSNTVRYSDATARPAAPSCNLLLRASSTRRVSISNFRATRVRHGRADRAR